MDEIIDNNTPLRKTEIVIADIKALVNSKGFIYAFCMILFEDFHVFVEELHELNYQERLSVKEASLLLGFLIQKELDFSIPDTPQDLIKLKQKTYKLMQELHDSFMIPFFEKLKTEIQKEHKKEALRYDQKEFFGKGGLLTEPIFYSGTGVYDFQYLEFLEKKYKYDKEWLLEKREFDFAEIIKISLNIKNILHKNSKDKILMRTGKKKVKTFYRYWNYINMWNCFLIIQKTMII